jgi:hypothetical protein
MKPSKKLNRKDFLKYGALLIGAPLLVSVNSSCSKITDTNDVDTTEKIDRAISESPQFAIQKPLSKTNSSDVFEIPADALLTSRGKVFMVVKVISKNNRNDLQTVVVDVLRKDNISAQVTGLKAGVEILRNPKETLKSLTRIDRVGVKNRFTHGRG